VIKRYVYKYAFSLCFNTLKDGAALLQQDQVVLVQW